MEVYGRSEEECEKKEIELARMAKRQELRRKLNQ